MQSFSQIVQNIRTTSVNAKQAGTKFEILVLRWFMATPLYMVKRGWLWADFAKAVGKDANDLGIDLVLEMHDGEFWAVQCKFYCKSSRIDEDKIAHFLGHQGMKFTIDRKSRTFTRFVWVDTDAVWGRNAEKYVHGRDKFTRLSMSVLANSNVNWDAIVKGNKANAEPKKPRDYQKEIIHKAEAHFKNNERGKVIMACGTGKTLTSQRIAEAVAGTCGTLILYCVPSIALLGQTYQSWAENAQHAPEDTQVAPLFAIGVCSDNRALEKTDHTGEATIDSPLPATTSVTAVCERILAARQMQKEGMSVIFTTYQSLQVVADAQQMVLDETDGTFGVFDMIICDEAHRTTGAAKDGFESSFMKIHDNGFIQAKKRLYMTATPRIYTVNAKSEAKKAASDAVVCSMDDAATYGEEIARIRTQIRLQVLLLRRQRLRQSLLLLRP
ncbi:MAG: DEAD/DEAH box helicase family protein [Proteobacteria bacterium]|nr:DEAD/DEAH box helicase family protein [Pseudomonadota bacterium]